MTAEPQPATGALAESDLSSPAQRNRRTRILDATMMLATKGGFDAVQMRAVAERADVALGTLYRYFPSKIHLLVSGLIREFSRTLDKLERSPVPGDTVAERVLYVLAHNTRSLQREPMLTEAITRAFMFADTSVTAEVTQVDRLSERMLTVAVGITDPTEEDKAIARVITDVWMANLIAWITRRASADDVTRRLELTVRLLMSPHSRPEKS
ncbi:cholesterol catabolism transcriptional regulator KstR [Pseudonocardia spinosispora]|uniref:cholesterol catabolism transcriptional regulator KstR n=1 Tax=Pseudonocardia spinosispora TaxID=103441 RepID=UPI0003F75F40|nr:cholesterol catabolism transcriptional regulator KstR [Pseudonocardia spinosispora]